ncbi:MAG TPA: BTAD domain-containing putative transcriptional regulator [Pantanalinema sp.]
MTPDASPPEHMPSLLPRPCIAARAHATGICTWILLAGPGWGKTCAARLIADALGLPQHWLDAGPGALARLNRTLAPGVAAAPEVLARLLSDRLRERFPNGVTVVFDRAEEGLFAPAFVRFMQAWFARVRLPIRTVVTSRRCLPVRLARQILQGTAAYLDVEALRLSEDEVRTWLAAKPAALAQAKDLAGWPLGVGALAMSGDLPCNEHTLKGLVREELLGPLPADLREVALGLSLLASPTAEALPVLGKPPEGIEALRRWGLVAGEPLTWHPLARQLLRAEWHQTLPPSEKAEQAQRASRWLASRDPGQAVVLLSEAGDEEAAVAALFAHAPELRLSGRLDQLSRLLERFDSRRAHDPRLILVDGILLEAKGYSAEARARYRAAADRFERSGDRLGLLEALNQLMRLAFDRDDLEDFEALQATAGPLVPKGEVRHRVEYLNLLGSHRYVQGDEEAASRHYLEVLDLPHFGQFSVAATQQCAAINLGIIELNRGELAQATLHFRHALALGEACRSRPAIHRLAILYLALLALHFGDRAQGEALYEAQAAEAALLDRSWSQWQLLLQEGDCLVLLGDHDQAEAKYREVLAILSAGGGAKRLDLDSILCRMAILHRRRGAPRAALALHVQTARSAGPWSYHRAYFLTQWGLTLLTAKSEAEALAKLEAAHAELSGRPARLLELDVLLPLALAFERTGQKERAGQALAAAVALMRELGVLYAPLALPEISEALWGLLLAHGHHDLVAEIASLFPDEASVVHEALVRNLGAGGLLVPPLPPPALRIRCFGSLEVLVGDLPPIHWPRKKAKVLLALLLFAPEGLSREALCELLIDPSSAEPERHLHDLSSALRKALEPSLAHRHPSRYLTFRDGWYRLSLKGAWLDVAEFERAYAQGKRAWDAGDRDAAVASFEAAMRLYRADLLSETVLLGWFEAERQHYRALALEMLDLLSAHHLAAEHLERGRAFTERLLQLDPTCEEAHRRLMALYGRFGQRELVRRQYEQCARALSEAFGAAPTDETRKLRDRLVQA